MPYHFEYDLGRAKNIWTNTPYCDEYAIGECFQDARTVIVQNTVIHRLKRGNIKRKATPLKRLRRKRRCAVEKLFPYNVKARVNLVLQAVGLEAR